MAHAAECSACKMTTWLLSPVGELSPIQVLINNACTNCGTPATTLEQPDTTIDPFIRTKNLKVTDLITGL